MFIQSVNPDFTFYSGSCLASVAAYILQDFSYFKTDKKLLELKYLT